jgi:acyl-CoA thioesterase-2
VECFPGGAIEGVTAQALLSYATDGFLIGTAMRPHEGFGQSMSHVSISTSVLSHTLTFHEPIDASQWYLLAHESPYAGRGRSKWSGQHLQRRRTISCVVRSRQHDPRFS